MKFNNSCMTLFEKSYPGKNVKRVLLYFDAYDVYKVVRVFPTQNYNWLFVLNDLPGDKFVEAYPTKWMEL
jgi:hypothetical protein